MIYAVVVVICLAMLGAQQPLLLFVLAAGIGIIELCLRDYEARGYLYVVVGLAMFLGFGPITDMLWPGEATDNTALGVIGYVVAAIGLIGFGAVIASDN